MNFQKKSVSVNFANRFFGVKGSSGVKNPISIDRYNGTNKTKLYKALYCLRYTIECKDFKILQEVLEIYSTSQRICRVLPVIFEL